MRSTTRTSLAIPAVLAALVLAGCSSSLRTSAGDSGGTSITDPATTRPPGTTAPPTTLPSSTISYDPHQVYEADATVLANAAHGPQACSMVLSSLPPQCSGLPLAHFAWADAPAASVSRQNGVTWAELHLTGTYDGTTFSLTEAPVAPGPDHSTGSSSPDFSAPCPAPAGGWAVTDPSKLSQADFSTVQAKITGAADYVTMWIDQSAHVSGAAGQAPSGVLVAAFTGNLEQHRAELAAVWGGAVCVIKGSVTNRQAMAARDRIVSPTSAHSPIGALSGGIGVRDGTVVVDVRVVVANAAVRAWVKARAGDVPVHLEGWLQPVNGEGGN